MGTLTYNDALELLGYKKAGRHGLEILGYEYSTQGRHRFETERPDIEPFLTDAVCRDLEHGGVFPRQYRFRRPECGVFVERRSDRFVLIDRDKPSAETRWIYETAAAAARALVRKCCDGSFLLRPEASDEFISVEYA